MILMMLNYRIDITKLTKKKRKKKKKKAFQHLYIYFLIILFFLHLLINDINFYLLFFFFLYSVLFEILNCFTIVFLDAKKNNSSTTVSGVSL